VRRLSLMRRMWNKFPECRHMVLDLWDIYHSGKTPGILGPSGLVGPDVFPAPPPGHQGRAVWKPTKQALGPVALSLFSVSQSAAALDRDFRIHRHD
jgi:hypothetical protein